MKPNEPEYLEFKVAGHTDESLFFFPGPCRCEDINNGVALAHGLTGQWVIRYEDLKTMYKTATKARKNSR